MTRDAGIFTIPSGLPFARTLVDGLLVGAKGDALALQDTTLLLPTRRAVRSVKEAFLAAAIAQGRGALFLPRLKPLGDVEEEELVFDADGASGLADALDDDVPPAMPALKRRFLLARLVERWSQAQPDTVLALGHPAHGLALAGELGRFLDMLTIEKVSPEALCEIVPGDFSAHWQRNLDFLRIVTEAWPEIAAEQGYLDAAERRNRLIERLAGDWRAAPPTGRVVAAGSTGSIPATAELLSVIARLPQGAVVLPGLDLEADEAIWQEIDPIHPQFGMKELLSRLGVDREAVSLWPGTGERAPPQTIARRRLLAEALRPAASSEAWRDAVVRFEKEGWARGLDGLSLIEAAEPDEEALVVALVLRETLETEGATAAVVTPDRDLARRIAAKLRRWGIEIDDSAGVALSRTAPGTFLRLVAVTARDEAAPVSLLSLLKHPFTACGLTRAALRERVGRLERAVLRGPRPAPGIAGLRAALAAADKAEDDLMALLDGLEAALAPFDACTRQASVPFAEIVTAHIAAAESLACASSQDGGRLWSGEAGEAAALMVRELLEEASDAAALEGRDYAAVFDALMDDRVVRPRAGVHPRLALWGPLEARLQSADTLVLAGLNEGTWPGNPYTDPWLSRPMRERLGLTAPERRIGLAAHDFVQGAMSGRVFLTRSARVDGTPTVPSRWILRLETLLKGAGKQRRLEATKDYLGWARALGQPPDFADMDPPAPTPPAAVRPRTLSVTQIETWVRDPYAIYARHVLGLKPLDPVDADPGSLERGTLIHHILDRFARRFPGDLPDDALARLMAIGDEEFAKLAARPRVRAFWWPRFERIARWLIDRERDWRRGVTAIHSECDGRLVLACPGGDFTVTARADRIDETAVGLVISDYKTGTPPTRNQVKAQLAPQLPLEGLIAVRGGFVGLPAAAVERLLYLRVSGGAEPGAECVVSQGADDTMELIAAAEAGLRQWIAEFDKPATPYRSRPRIKLIKYDGDYDHLARVKEWSGAGAEGDAA